MLKFWKRKFKEKEFIVLNKDDLNFIGYKNLNFMRLVKSKFFKKKKNFTGSDCLFIRVDYG